MNRAERPSLPSARRAAHPRQARARRRSGRSWILATAAVLGLLLRSAGPAAGADVGEVLVFSKYDGVARSAVIRLDDREIFSEARSGELRHGLLWSGQVPAGRHAISLAYEHLMLPGSNHPSWRPGIQGDWKRAVREWPLAVRAGEQVEVMLHFYRAEDAKTRLDHTAVSISESRGPMLTPDERRQKAARAARLLDTKEGRTRVAVRILNPGRHYLRHVGYKFDGEPEGNRYWMIQLSSLLPAPAAESAEIGPVYLERSGRPLMSDDLDGVVITGTPERSVASRTVIEPGRHCIQVRTIDVKRPSGSPEYFVGPSPSLCFEVPEGRTTEVIIEFEVPGDPVDQRGSGKRLAYRITRLEALTVEEDTR